MALKITAVSKCLDKRLQIFGFEVFDLLLLFLFMSVLNLVFGNTPLKIFVVWIPSLVLAITLRFGKRGKPEKFLVHWLRFQIQPGILCAFKDFSVKFEPLHKNK